MAKDFHPLGRRLGEILRLEQYVPRWIDFASPRTRSHPDPRAIAEMIRRSPRPEAMALDEISDSALEARVRRLLGGVNASAATLSAIRVAAGLSDAHVQELNYLFLYAEAPLAVSFGHDARRTLDPPAWRTLLLTERHWVGADRAPARHVTGQTIEALADLDRYPYRFDTDAATVRVLEGGAPGSLYEIGDDYYAVDIVFDRRLAERDQLHLEYETQFAYDSPPEPAFRRASLRMTIPTVDITVEFHPDAVPKAAWWASWPSPDAPEPSSKTPVDIVERRLFRNSVLEAGHTIGFLWQF